MQSLEVWEVPGMTGCANLHLLETFSAQNKGHMVRLGCTTCNSGLHNAWQLDPAVCHLVADLLVDASLVNLSQGPRLISEPPSHR